MVGDAGTRPLSGGEQEAGAVEDVADGKDEPGILLENVGDEEIDLGGTVGEHASVDAAVRVDAIKAIEQSGGGFDLNAPQLSAVWFEFWRILFWTVRIARVEIARVQITRIQIPRIKDEVVALAVAVRLGDAEAQAGGFVLEGQFGEFSAAL